MTTQNEAPKAIYEGGKRFVATGEKRCFLPGEYVVYEIDGKLTPVLLDNSDSFPEHKRDDMPGYIYRLDEEVRPGDCFVDGCGDEFIVRSIVGTCAITDSKYGKHPVDTTLIVKYDKRIPHITPAVGQVWKRVDCKNYLVRIENIDGDWITYKPETWCMTHTPLDKFFTRHTFHGWTRESEPVKPAECQTCANLRKAVEEQADEISVLRNDLAEARAAIEQYQNRPEFEADLTATAERLDAELEKYRRWFYESQVEINTLKDKLRETTK